MVLTVNLLGLRHLTEALVDRLPVGGSVVNVASTAGSEWMSVMEPIFEGTSEIQRLVIARAISGVHIR